MKTYIYTHIADDKGKMVEKGDKNEPTEKSSIDYKRWYNETYLPSLTTIDTIGFSSSDNGKTFNEDEFEIQTHWVRNTDRSIPTLADLDEIAVPLSEKREESEAMGIKDFIHKGIEFSQKEQFKHSGESYRSGVGFGYSCGYQDGWKEKREERTQDEMWEEVQKIMAHTKYPLDYARTSDGKSNLNIMVVDITKVIKLLKSKFSITLK